MTRLRDRVGRAIAAHGLWAAGERVTVAVSGGVDSMVLLDLLLATSGWHGGRLGVITIDHGTRPDSAAHAAFVADHAASRGLPCQVVRVTPEHGSEDAWRRARFAVFDTLDTDVVALGHHRDDQAETVLIRLLRGTAPRGLEGMAWRRGRYARPLLDVARAEIAAYAAAGGLPSVEDPTNADPGHLRNRVRHEVLPLLESVRQGATAALARSATLAALDGAVLDRLATGADPCDRGWLIAADEAVARRALHRRFPAWRSAHVDAVLDAARKGQGVVDVPGGRVAVDLARLRWIAT